MPIRPEVDQMIEFLDSLAKVDPEAMGRLVSARVSCNKAMADHPTVQVARGGELGIPAGEHGVGIIGILNGWGGSFDDGPRKGWGAIAAVFEDDGSLSGFRRSDALSPSQKRG